MPVKKDFYEVYCYGDNLKPGNELKIEHSIHCEWETDISTLIKLSAEDLQDRQKTSTEKETAVFDKLCAAVSEWEEQAAQTQLLDRALQYVRTPPIEHTANQWKAGRYGDGQEISNMVYHMSHSIYEDCEYDRNTKKRIPVAWYVTWNVDVKGRGQNGYGSTIAGQRQKRYTDKAAAEKYLQGRIAAYAHLFKEVSPPIPPEYAEHFKINGQLLPGYTIAGQEPQRAASEVSESGVFASKQEKPSVLGQLAAGKAQAKEIPAMDVSPKKPEPEI